MKKFIATVAVAGILFTGYGMEFSTPQESFISVGAKRAEAAAVKDLGITFKQFADNFANTLDSMGNYSQYYIFNATFQSGSVKDAFKYNFHSNLSMLATVSHSTGNIIEVSFIASPQSEAQIVEMITLYGILMKTLNRGMSNEQMNQLLRQLYCHPDNILELIDKSGKVTFGNIKYTTFL